MRDAQHSLGNANLRLLLDAYRRCSRHKQSLSPPSSSSSSYTSSSSSSSTPCNKPTLLVSACLLGQLVTYRGGSCAPKGCYCTPVGFLLNCLWQEHSLIDCLPICPEMDLLEMPSPRPPLRLVRNSSGGRHKLVLMSKPISLLSPPAVEPPENYDKLRKRLTTRHPRVAEELLSCQLSGVDGCLFKSRSPSCGVRDARLYELESGGSYEEVDGFFVDEWVRSVCNGAVSIPLATERQLYFDDGESNNNNGGRLLRAGQQKCTYGLLSFVHDFVARFEARVKSKPLVNS